MLNLTILFSLSLFFRNLLQSSMLDWSKSFLFLILVRLVLRVIRKRAKNIKNKLWSVYRLVVDGGEREDKYSSSVDSVKVSPPPVSNSRLVFTDFQLLSMFKFDYNRMVVFTSTIDGRNVGEKSWRQPAFPLTLLETGSFVRNMFITRTWWTRIPFPVVWPLPKPMHTRPGRVYTAY